MPAHIPDEEALRGLPLRALVAFACRCAARVQPMPSRELKDYSNAVGAAITVAHQFARGASVTGEAAERLADDVVNAAEILRDRPGGLYAAGYAAGWAAKAASTAAFTITPPGAPDFGIANALAARLVAVSASDATRRHAAATAAAADEAVRGRLGPGSTGSTDPAAMAARQQHALRMWADLKCLAGMSLGAFPQLGERVDPSPTGPLGAY